ncbi:MAG: TIGR00730 family Rossman fold protein [Flavobacteriaceae bacterium]|nr:TIGR00730 family Rossman fold protein [Flavobacteriaceae bacterium]
MKKIAVFCGSSTGFSTIYKEEAQKVGEYFAQNSIALVYGGGKIGMMGVLANTIMKNQGEVYGVIPKLLEHEEVIHDHITQLIITKTMSERKIIMSQMVDGYIALPGGFGTLDELFEALTLGQLGIEDKPVGVLNTNGFFEPTMKQLDLMVNEGFLKESNRNMLLIEDSIESLIHQMHHYKAPTISKIVNTVSNK